MAKTKTANLLIRDDGVLCPRTPLTERQHNLRPYRGDPYASLEDRLAWLRNGEHIRSVAPELPDTFDIGKASKADLADFALTEFGEKLDLRKGVDTLRAEVAALAQASPNDDVVG